MNKEYIGDGVYAEYSEYSIILTTEDGISITNIIVLDAEVLHNLNEYLRRMFYSSQLGVNLDKPKRS